MRAKKILVTAVAVMAMLAMSFTSMATAYHKTIYLYANQAWTDRYENAGVRTGNNSYASVKCHEVYPVSGLDTFTKIRVRLADTYGNDLSSIYVVKEGETDYTKVYLLEGTLTTTNFYYEFSGNSNYEAYTKVSYVDN